MRIVYLTDGNSRRIHVGKTEIFLKRSTPKNMHAAGRLGGLVVQALRHFGKASLNDVILGRLRDAVPAGKRAEVIRDSLAAPAWVRDAVRKALADSELPR